MGRKLKNPLPQVNMGNIGKQLADIRKSKGFTQTQLANLIGINQRLVSDYELGRVALSADMLARFCHVLRCSSDDIFNLPKAKTNLRLVKRMNEINKLPENTKKYIIKVLDDTISANKRV
jgi:transcriptional regulator with XRE-family HTH domain